MNSIKSNRNLGYTIAVSAGGALVSITAQFLNNMTNGTPSLSDMPIILGIILVGLLVTFAVLFGNGREWTQVPLQILFGLVSVGLLVLLVMASVESNNSDIFDTFMDVGIILMICAPLVGTTIALGGKSLTEK